MGGIATLFKNKRQIIAHSVVFIIFLSFLYVNARFEYPHRRISAYFVFALFIGFYLHSLILMPIFLKGKSLKYVLFIILSLLMFCSLFLWLEAERGIATNLYLRGLEINGASHDDIVKGQNTLLNDPLAGIQLADYFLSKNWLINQISGFLIASIPFWFVSTSYTLVVSDKNNLKKSFTNNQIELFVNLTIIVLFSLIVLLDNHPGDLFIRLYVLYFVAFVFYTNVFFVTPILVVQRKVLKYIISLVGLIVMYFILLALTSLPKVIILSELWNSLVTMATMTFLLVLLFCSLIYGYVRIKMKAKESFFVMRLGAKDTELNLLKSQVNPHFLFNSLNTLYATALEENAPKSAESIAKLSNLIRYMQEDINKDFIPLEKEVQYIKDFIAIQELRCAVQPEIKAIFNCSDHYSISPGLLIPFVENAFKYGIDPSKPSKLNVSVTCVDNIISFKCVNSFDEAYKAYHKEQGFGIGIKNAQQRLELVYPKKHTFEILKEQKLFSVKITIKID